MTPRSRAYATLAVVAALFVTTSCAAPDPAPAGPSSLPSSNAESPTPTPTATADAEPAGEPTCDTIIPENTVAEFERVSISFEQEEMRIGGTPVEGGIQCMWANFDGPATDHVLIFGWAPMAAKDATIAEDALEAEGWVREEGDEGVYLTENPDIIISKDDEGYGMTYLFGEGWVKLADTKQGLLLVDWPR